MVGQYFKRRRELVEILLVGSSGLGISTMSFLMQVVIKEIGWRLGLQAVTGLLATTFILGLFYRSATLYHPQRRAILHLKTQKRKIKEKNKSQEARASFFDKSCLKSRTIQILLTSAALAALGLHTPIIYLAFQAEFEGVPADKVAALQVYLGLSWALGTVIFGCVVLQKSRDCRVGRQYLCQICLLVCGLSLLALSSVQGYNSYLTFTCVYGLFLGAYHYSLGVNGYYKHAL